MARVPTIIYLETAFNGKKEIIWLKAAEIYQFHRAEKEKKNWTSIFL